MNKIAMFPFTTGHEGIKCGFDVHGLHFFFNSMRISPNFFQNKTTQQQKPLREVFLSLSVYPTLLYMSDIVILELTAILRSFCTKSGYLLALQLHLLTLKSCFISQTSLDLRQNLWNTHFLFFYSAFYRLSLPLSVGPGLGYSRDELVGIGEPSQWSQ